MLLPMLLRRRSPKLLAIQFGLLGVLLVLTFVFHLSGTLLVEVRIARLVLLVALLGAYGLMSRRRRRDAVEDSSVNSAS